MKTCRHAYLVDVQSTNRMVFRMYSILVLVPRLIGRRRVVMSGGDGARGSSPPPPPPSFRATRDGPPPPPHPSTSTYPSPPRGPPASLRGWASCPAPSVPEVRPDDQDCRERRRSNLMPARVSLVHLFASPGHPIRSFALPLRSPSRSHTPCPILHTPMLSLPVIPVHRSIGRTPTPLRGRPLPTCLALVHVCTDGERREAKTSFRGVCAGQPGGDSPGVHAWAVVLDSPGVACGDAAMGDPRCSILHGTGALLLLKTLEACCLCRSLETRTRSTRKL